MLNRLVLHAGSHPVALRAEVQQLSQRYPWLAIVYGPSNDPASVTVDRAVWCAADFDPVSCDLAVARVLAEAGSLSLHVTGSAPEGAPTQGLVPLQVVTRYQRLLEGRNLSSADPLFDRALGLHRALHDRRKPLVGADFDHTVDTWRWVLRLAPEASLAVQLAALFHDIERLQSESEVRVEHRSPSYQMFKQTHAAAGALMVGTLLQQLGASAALEQRVVELVRDHERPHDDPEKQLLNEADALSYFSLNACGFIAYYGIEHTRRKVAYTLERLGPRGWGELQLVRHRDDIQGLINDWTGGHPEMLDRPGGGEVVA